MYSSIPGRLANEFPKRECVLRRLVGGFEYKFSELAQACGSADVSIVIYLTA